MAPFFRYAILIDDEEISNFIVQTWLQKHGLAKQYHVFANPEAALTFLSQHQNGELPDLVLVDIHMPIMSGLELLQAVFDQPSQAPRKIYWYVLTSSLHPKDLQQASSFPIDGYLTKPLNEAQTEKILKRVQQRSQSE